MRTIPPISTSHFPIPIGLIYPVKEKADDSAYTDVGFFRFSPREKVDESCQTILNPDYLCILYFLDLRSIMPKCKRSMTEIEPTADEKENEFADVSDLSDVPVTDLSDVPDSESIFFYEISDNTRLITLCRTCTENRTSIYC